MTHRVTLIPGDGIGPEVCDAARSAVEATGVAIEWDVQEFGAEAYLREGPALLERVIASVRERGVALKGPTSTPSGSGFRSINIALRRDLDLYAGVRPCRALPGVATPFPQTDVVVVRMNTEDLYAGIEYGRDEDAAATLREIVRRDARDGAAGGHRHLPEAAVADRRGESCASCFRLRTGQRAPARDRGAQGDRHARHRRAVPRGVPRGGRRLQRRGVRRPAGRQRLREARDAHRRTATCW